MLIWIKLQVIIKLSNDPINLLIVSHNKIVAKSHEGVVF